ncbi:MAG: diaminopimelate decarboxylase [Myxococcota bacterium]
MIGFAYREGRLFCEEVPLEALADAQGTPLYVYSAGALDAAFAAIDGALDFAPHLVAYAVKANGNLGLLARLARLGAGADIVSGGELLRALEAGIPPQRIVFSGVGKRDDEIELALSKGIRSLHAESAAEVDAIDAIARRLGTKAPLALRVNPDVDPRTHPYIATGLHESKFGIEIPVVRELVPRILASAHLELEGIACHIGSQLPSPAPLEEATTRVAELALELQAAGAPVRVLDTGGGWPLAYGNEERAYPPMWAYGAAIRRGLEAAGASDAGLELVVEPGRSLVGGTGALLTRVLYVKDRPRKRFLVVDAAMTELIRPALYQAYHAARPVREPEADAARGEVDIVGPVCETGDFLAQNRAMPPMTRGDLIAFEGAGAYAACMASNYNARPRPAEVLVEGARWHVIRERERVAQLWENERIPR